MAKRKTIAQLLSEAVRSDARTQQEIAAAAGVSQPTIHKILNGGDVMLTTAERVARAVKCTLTLVEQ